MNKWIKNSVAGLIFSTSAVAIAGQSNGSLETEKFSGTIQAIDVTNEVAGKLKDRLIMSTDDDNIELVRVLIDSDLLNA